MNDEPSNTVVNESTGITNGPLPSGMANNSTNGLKFAKFSDLIVKEGDKPISETLGNNASKDGEDGINIAS